MDRDGVLNDAIVRDGKPYPPASVDELEIAPGVAEAVRSLKEAGFILIVVSNQPDVARGTMSQDVVEAINARIGSVMPIDRFIVCYHQDADGCDCRKPKPGMLFAGANDFGVDLSRSYMVGDRWRDVTSGRSAGCRTIFVDHSYAEQQPTGYDHRVCSLAEAATIILAETNP